MGILSGFEKWTKTGYSFEDLLKGVEAKSPYLVGKEGLMPDWKIKGKPIGDIFSREGYVAGGAWYRKKAEDVFGGFAEGFFPKGEDESDPYNLAGLDPRNLSKWAEDQSTKSQQAAYDYFDQKQKDFQNWLDSQKTKAGGLIPEGGLVQMPEIVIPTIDLSPFAAGLAGMGAGVGAGLAGLGMPQMPSLTDDEGAPNIALIAALAVAGLGGVYLLKKG